MTFRLDTPEGIEAARSWDYFAEGQAAAEDTRWSIAPVLKGNVWEREPLIPSRTFGYHELGQVWHERHRVSMTLSELDTYRCWPPAPDVDKLRDQVHYSGTMTPLVIYSNGTHAVLGDGNHRLQVAKELRWDFAPVVVVPDRLKLPRGMDHTHLAPLGPLAKTMLSSLVDWHDYHPERRRLIEGGVAHVWCSCGASWKRNA